MAEKVLVVDGNNAQFRQFQGVLASMNLECERMTDCLEIENKVILGDYQTIIIGLSTFSDIATIGRIKKLTKYRSSVIVVGTEAHSRLIDGALEEGADDFLWLPAADEILRLKLKNLNKQSMKKIEKNIKYLETIFDMVFTPAVIVDFNGRIVEANYACLQQYSVTKEAITGELFGRLINCSRRKFNTGYFHDGCGRCKLCDYGEAAALRDHVTRNQEHTYISDRNGIEEERTIRVSYAPVLRNGEKMIFINFEDITVKKKTEDVLCSCLRKLDTENFKDKETRIKIETFTESVRAIYDKLEKTLQEYGTLLDNILSGFLLLEENNFGELIIKEVNKRLCEIFSTTREKVIGENFSTMLVGYDPKLSDALHSVIETGERKRIEYESKVYDKWLKINIFMINPTTVVLIIGDNTVSRLSHLKMKDYMKRNDMRNYQFELFMEGSQDGAWSYDYDENKIYLSAQFKRLLGYLPNDLKISGMEDFINLISVEDRSRFAATIEDVNAGKIEKLEEEVRMVKQNGEKLWVLVRATVRIEIVSGTPQLLGGVITDISQRKSIEEKLRNSNTELEKAVETKNKFISIISHDLRNQFNAITGLSEILTKRLQDYDDDRNSQMALVINQSSKSAYKLLNDLLTWARSQANSIEFKPETLNVTTVTEEAFNEIRIQAQKKHISLLNETGNDDTVWADRQMYLTIIRNIATNAIKFTNDDGFVSVTSSMTDTSTIITIKDNGVGMSEEQVKRLMTVSQNKSTTGTSGEKGSGIGLLICKEFVGKHSGTIKIESEEGKGTKFMITFPKQKLS